MSEPVRTGITIKKIGTVTVNRVFNGGTNGGTNYLEKMGVEEVDSVEHKQDFLMKSGLNEDEFKKAAEIDPSIDPAKEMKKIEKAKAKLAELKKMSERKQP